MIIFHGTNELFSTIDLDKCRLRTDFGKGFYMSSDIETARVWASGKAGFAGIPTVMKYEINDDILNICSLSTLQFNGPTKEWLDFIYDNRRRSAIKGQSSEPRHSYDIVFGPIANDKVVDVVDLYFKGKINADEAITRLKALPDVMQISLHTTLALSNITYMSFSQKKGSTWSEWK